jgi:hypothetical protein
MAHTQQHFRHLVRLGQGAAAGGLLAAAAACAPAAAPRPPALPPAAAERVPHGQTADWRSLLLVPLGSRLTELHVALEEVLFFHGSSGGGVPEDPECYAPHAAPMRFAGRETVEYLLCFDHGGLNRVRASVNLPAASARNLLARYCGDWLAPLNAANDACAGGDGTSAFSARLDPEPVQGARRLSIVIYGAASPTPPDAEFR